MQDVLLQEFSGHGIVDSAKWFGDLLQVIVCVPQLNAGPEQKPVRSSFAKRHASAARVDDARSPDHAIELHMGMAADDDALFDAGKHRLKTIFRGAPEEDVGVVARCGMAEQNVAYTVHGKAKCGRPGCEQRLMS